MQALAAVHEFLVVRTVPSCAVRVCVRACVYAVQGCGGDTKLWHKTLFLHLSDEGRKLSRCICVITLFTDGYCSLGT